MPKVRYYLPVLLLYMITSVIFVAVFAGIFYQQKKDELLSASITSLRNEASIISHALRKGYLDERGGFRDYEAVIFDAKKGEFLAREFEPDFEYVFELFKSQTSSEKAARAGHNFDADFSAQAIKDFELDLNKRDLNATKADSKPRRLLFFVSDERYVYYFDGRNGISVLLRSDMFAHQLSALKSWLFILCACASLAMCVVAYFIVRMSYAPLLRHINGLNAFITDTTHEINTPLSVILMSVEMFEKNPPKYLENIRLAARTLSMLYSDLSANLKAVPLSLGECDIKALIEQRVRFFEPLAAKKELSFELSLPESFTLNTDEYRISKIIDNLLSNAVKYSNKAEKIYINLDESGISVAQKGVVIPPEKMSKIYDKFTRFDTTNGGFGVGLSLVKTYCCELGYTINCTSSEEQTKFSVSFKKA